MVPKAKASAAGDDELANASDALYIAVANQSREETTGSRSKVFYQEELMQIAGVDSMPHLMPMVQFLINANLFRTLKIQGKLGWSVRPRSAAKQILTLDRDEKLIYEIVEESHTRGIWSKDVKNKTSINQNTVAKCLTKMEKSGLIKGIKNVRSPHQRTYMLSHLLPSEDVTGNSFFDMGDLDESFRDELLNLIIFWVRNQSWVEAKKKSKKEAAAAPTQPLVVEDDDAAAEKGKKRKRTVDIEDVAGKVKHRSHKYDPETDFTQLVYRAGTHNYPTAEQIHHFLTTSNAIKPTKAAQLTVPEIQGCIDVLCWDEKLEKVANKNTIEPGYRTVRGVSFKPLGMTDFEEYMDVDGTGLTQTPCGRCPVFDICHEGGPVNAEECIYFEQWLKS